MTDPLRTGFSGNDRFNARHSHGAALVQPTQDGMRMRRSHDPCIEHPTRVQVGDEPGLTNHFFVTIHTRL
jgi:hypothetical protein